VETVEKRIYLTFAKVAVLSVLKMANLVVTIKVMPASLDVELKKLESKCQREIEHFGGKVGKVLTEDIAFGLKALNILFTIDEKTENMDDLEEKIGSFEEVNSAKVVDMRRAIG